MLSDQVAARLRACGMSCTGVSLAIRDPGFRDLSRQQRLQTPTALGREISAAAMHLARQCWNESSPVRAMTVTAISLIPEGESGSQMDLLARAEQEERREKLDRLERCMDQIRAKYGKTAIAAASAPGIREGTALQQGEKEPGK